MPNSPPQGQTLLQAEDTYAIVQFIIIDAMMFQDFGVTMAGGDLEALGDDEHKIDVYVGV